MSLMCFMLFQSGSGPGSPVSAVRFPLGVKLENTGKVPLQTSTNKAVVFFKADLDLKRSKWNLVQMKAHI